MNPTVLVLTSLEDVTADRVVEALNARAVPVVRADPADIGRELAFGFHIGPGRRQWSGWLRTATRMVEPTEIGAVYWRRPTPYACRFSHLPAQQRDFASAEARHGLGGVLNSLSSALYVNHPHAVTRADFKPAQLQRLTELGLRIPPTLITNDMGAAQDFADRHERVVYKTFRGLPRCDSGQTGAIWTQRIDPTTFDDSLRATAHLFQAEIPKTCDVRVTVISDRVFAQRITTPNGDLDWRRGDWNELIHSPVTVPASIEGALHGYLASFGLVFGCFDFAITGEGEDSRDWWAIECNPNGQWGWLPDAPAIAEAFADILTLKGGGDSDLARRS
ncbi:ATP-grasp ribosomal peptide maturase [Streptomyces sp. NPDC127063]|uniref:ATP-grasp ribosomal peptide maturase n=1 Tax=Streptomyces sp. NPDC127063 TaxID=3347123 RepID=UPI0036661C4A